MYASPPALLSSPDPPYHPITSLHVPLTHAPCHSGHYAQARRYGRSLKVLAFSGSVFRKRGHGDVEAGEAREAAEDEEGQEERIERGAEAEREGGGGGGDTERYLEGRIIPSVSHPNGQIFPWKRKNASWRRRMWRSL